jgi:hypothetical protein
MGIKDLFGGKGRTLLRFKTQSADTAEIVGELLARLMR